MPKTDGAAAVKHEALLRRGLRLEYATLGWNVIGLGVLAAASIGASSPALAGFGIRMTCRTPTVGLPHVPHEPPH